ncbi:DUF2196 domain-containing protein (plasmid) [Aneurinibacillus sp. Ricciae_BoGa-3]|uniref:DUF2196 domain-containing protein n=1 Tax=Aneurinibacillus sp. Ricciae_BoGa-3 TaxID=3022697 RepID=UPI00233FA869|nr:DUF2196 domain-containing protein [Aneurinibacillus sp. Ricciae_BoGa-3]WCK57268.1 DUF2196 domain-containing protein [Aneurinibacillus sp. Ricciae_BoGa-3]
MDIDVTLRKNIIKGLLVDIIADEDKETVKLTRGYVANVLSKENNKKGIRVELSNGKRGRVYSIPSKDDIKRENFKFYNIFFFLPKIYSVWNQTERKYMIIHHMNQAMGRTEKTALLFTDKEKAKAFIKGTMYEGKDFAIREINRNKPIPDNFKTLDVDYFRIDGERKLSFERLIEWEQYFKNMR